MALRSADIVAALILNIIHCAYSTDRILSCNVTAFGPCPGQHQVCEEATHQCVCEKGFSWVGDNCEIPGPPPEAHHGATAAVVTVFTLALVICGLVLVIRKYNLVEYARQKIMRRNNDVMYEDVMIGQDDPPLSP